MMPMVCDILKFEYFYTPGTIIVCDGRSANAKFLKDHFERKWKYINDKKNVSAQINKEEEMKRLVSSRTFFSVV